MRAAGAVQVTGDDVIDMIAMWKCVVSAIRTVLVSCIVAAAGMVGCALALVSAVNRQAVFIYMITMHMVQVVVVEIVGMTIVLNCFVPAVGTVLVLVGTVCSAAHPSLSPFVVME